MHEILDKEEIAPRIHQAVIRAPLVARRFRPGNFLILRIDERGERIPLTAADWDAEQGTVTVVVQEIGKTTMQFGMLQVGDCIRDVVGPLGNAREPERFGNICLVAGGVGAAEMLPEARAFKAAGNQLVCILGSRTKDLMIFEKELGEVCGQILVCTNDGSYGRHGFVTDVLKDLLEQGRKFDLVFAVGPLPMMQAVCELTKQHGLRTEVSLETIMVDGTGMCGSCRLTVAGKVQFACVDGPTFDGHQVDFVELAARQRRFAEQEKMARERFAARLEAEKVAQG